MDEIIKFGKTISNPLRLRMLVCLLQREMAKEDLLRVFTSERPDRLEQQLDVLRYAELIVSERYRRSAVYRLNPEREDLLRCIVEAFSNTVEWDSQVTQDLARLKSLASSP